MKITLPTSILLYLLLSISAISYAQDSLEYGQTFQLDGLHRAFCSTSGIDALNELNEEFNDHYLDSVAAFIRSNPQSKFEIRCFTDSRGRDSMNRVLSQQRADEWVDYLVKRGVNRDEIEGIGVGEMFPRKVWCKDTIYFMDKPNDQGAIEVLLTDDYINSFRRDPRRFSYLHSLNRRVELTVAEIDRRAQTRINYALYLKHFYGNRNVVKIGAGLIENSDTLKLEHSADLYLHLVAPGTENDFTIQSLERDNETYRYNKFVEGKESLLNLSSAKGLYRIEVFGDGGSGEMILDISNSTDQ